MENLNGRVAVITGGGGGIGRGMALAFAEHKMKIVLADIDPSAAKSVADEITAAGGEAIAAGVDVVDRDSVAALADTAFDAFGAVNVLCNNAGVTAIASLNELTYADWDWVLGVNLNGVVNCIQTFLPRMMNTDGGSHIVNTSSTVGLGPIPWLGPYAASKNAMIGLTDSIRVEGGAWGMSASALCPGNVNTGIVKSGRNRQSDFGGPTGDFNELVNSAIEQGEDPEEVGRAVREGILDDDPFIFTHPESRTAIQNRYDAMIKAQEKAERRLAARG